MGLKLVNSINRGLNFPIAAIVERIHALGSDIGVVNYSHVRRTSNQSAHILDRQAQSLVNDVIWIEETPCCIQQALV